MDNPTTFAIQVNDSDTYKFYVINDNGEEVTMIMDRNLGSQVEWISNTDYGCEYAWQSINDKGPITALKELKTRTSTWINIPERVYTYSDDGGGNKYENFTEISRARILRYEEAKNLISIGNGIMPKWLSINLSVENTYDKPYGYWTTGADKSQSGTAYVVYHNNWLTNAPIYYNIENGIRPVITIKK